MDFNSFDEVAVGALPSFDLGCAHAAAPTTSTVAQHRAKRAEAVVRDVRIEAEHFHAERLCARRDLAADAPDTDDPERAPFQLAPEQL